MKLAGGDTVALPAAPLPRGEGGARRSGNATGKGAEAFETAFADIVSGPRPPVARETEASPHRALQGKEPERKEGGPAGEHPLPDERPARIVALPETLIGLRAAEMRPDPQAKAASEEDGEEPGLDPLPDGAKQASEVVPPALPLVIVPLQDQPAPQALLPSEIAPQEKRDKGSAEAVSYRADDADGTERLVRAESLPREIAETPQPGREARPVTDASVTVRIETEAGPAPGERVSAAAAVSLWAMAGGTAQPASAPLPLPLVAQATAPDLAAAIQTGLGAWPAEGSELAARLSGSPRSLVIELRPAELGTVTARLRISGSAIEVDLQVETPEARDRLGADGGESILRALQALGIEVERVSVATAAAPPAGGEARTFTRGNEGAGAGPGGGQPGGYEGSRDGGREGAHGWQDGRQNGRGGGGGRAQRGVVDELFI